MQISKWVALGVAAFCLVAVGGVVNMPHLYFMAAMLVTLPAVSYIMGWFTLRGLEFKRQCPTLAWEGEVVDITYTVTNPSRLTRFFVSIAQPTDAMIESVEMTPSLFSVKPHDTIEVHNRVRFLRRGVFQAGAFDVSALDPLGVFTFERTVPSDDELLVYPTPRQLHSVDLYGAESVGWNGMQVHSRHGDGVDASGVRGYQPGDPLRRIHWRQTARTGRLSVIEFDEIQSLSLTIVVDSYLPGVVGQEPNTTLEYAIRLAATVARDTIQNGAAVDLHIAGTDAGGSAPAWNGLMGERGESRLFAILDGLARIEAQSNAALSQLLNIAADTVSRSTTLLALCIHADPDLPLAVSKCVARGIAVTLIYMEPNSFKQSEADWTVYGVNPVIREVSAMGLPVYAVTWNAEHMLRAISLD